MSNAIYKYNGRDITINVCIQIRDVINIIKRDESLDSFMDAAKVFYNSQTIEDLKNVSNGLWAESAEFIADQFYEEKEEKERNCSFAL
jgi:hypothetical protein